MYEIIGNNEENTTKKTDAEENSSGKVLRNRIVFRHNSSQLLFGKL